MREVEENNSKSDTRTGRVRSVKCKTEIRESQFRVLWFNERATLAICWPLIHTVLCAFLQPVEHLVYKRLDLVYLLSFVKPGSNRHTELLTGNLTIKINLKLWENQSTVQASPAFLKEYTSRKLFCPECGKCIYADTTVYKPVCCAGSKLNGFYPKSYIFPASWLAKALSSVTIFFCPKRWFCFEAFCCHQHSLMWFLMNSSQASLGWCCHAPLTLSHGKRSDADHRKQLFH